MNANKSRGGHSTTVVFRLTTILARGMVAAHHALPSGNDEPSATTTTAATTIRPHAVDMRLSDSALREACRAGLEGTLTPMLALHHHGCAAELAELAARARAHHRLDSSSLPPQCACDFDGPLEPPAREVRTKLTALCERLLEVLVGEAAPLDGRICMRTYPRAAPADGDADADADANANADGSAQQRLGAHCDNTLLTLLWADGPGLQVLHPGRADGWTPERVMRYGLPTMSDADEIQTLGEEQWATVELPWADGPLLLTLGCAWMSSELTRDHPAQCAVLHRVVLPPGYPRDRHSIPFLVDLAGK